MTPKQERFVEEYLIDLNATQAAIRAGYSAKTAYSIGQRLLKEVETAEAIAAGQAKRSAKTEITAERVLEELWAIATADANDLIQYRRGACAKCWQDGDEISEELEAQAHGGALRRARRGGEAHITDGDPNPDCEHCHGEGAGRAFVHDTRLLTGGARKLYAGVKVTKDGFEVKMHDRAAALVNVGKHLGMFGDKLDLNVIGSLATEIEEARQRARART